jgi:hypothetical protein
MARLLKLDIDFKPPKTWLDEWIRTRKLLLEKLGYDYERFDVFQTERGIHVYITLRQNIKSARTVNRLQWLLGDDATRVKINQWRIERGIRNWNKLYMKVLYRKKAKVVTCHYCGNKIPVG